LLAKGFIGPIGDDIPSLIPLLLGLVIFFSTFTTAFNSFDRINTEFDSDLAVMNITRIMQSNSYVVGYDEYKRHCDEIGVVNSSFIAVLTDNWVNESTALPDAQSIFDIKIFEDSENHLYTCSNLSSSGAPEFISDYLSAENAAERKVSSRVFPIALEDEKIVKPMHLVVITWR